GDSMVLDVSQEISSIAQSAAGAVDLIVNKRTIDTTVIVDDGEILVLGGLLEDVLRESDQRVPVLGRIPLLGNLFRSRKTEKLKTNLMVFIRPTILRDATQTAFETNQKYNLIRDVQQGRKGDDIRLMPGQSRPMLPPIEEYRKARQPEEDEQ
ncbi:MAG: type II secretion system protein GspD, partial [Gammaproteobacteria bacterium]|nr:type II secretion system protein GspD [Gammaproteobacteria bacterium]